MELVDNWKHEVDFTTLIRFRIPDFSGLSGYKLTCCEWRQSVYGIESIIDKCGRRSYVYEPPHSAVLHAMKSATEWANETITVFGGMVWSEYEMVDFAYDIEEVQPLVAVAITPFSFEEPESLALLWGEVISADSALYGSILNQRWKIYIWGRFDSDFIHFDVLHQLKRVLADGYCDACFNPKHDEEGLMGIVPFDSLSGLTVTVRALGGIRYSANAHIPQMTLIELWTWSTL